MQSKKLVGGATVPTLTFSKLGGGSLSVGGNRDRWTLLVIYRGKHCPRCKRYLNTLEQMKADWESAGFDLIVVSADPEAKAAADLAEFGWSFDIGYDLNEDQMHALGLYVSDPLSPTETDKRFAEPGVFCIRPDGELQLVTISNGPAARPDLVELLDGCIFNIKNDRPYRGTVTASLV
jgi:peroxiredoxin